MAKIANAETMVDGVKATMLRMLMSCNVENIEQEEDMLVDIDKKLKAD